MIRGREVLLAVDVGLSTGIAVFDDQGQLSRYRSHHLPDKSAFRRWVAGILIEFPELKYVIVEGGGELAEIWQKAVARKKLRFLRIDAGRWRRTFLLPRSREAAAFPKRTPSLWPGK